MEQQQLFLQFNEESKSKKDIQKLENERAFRISLRMRENHLLLASVYENLVDRDFKLVEQDIKMVIMDLKLILKSIEDDDF